MSLCLAMAAVTAPHAGAQGLDVRPENSTCFAPARPSSSEPMTVEPVYRDIQQEQALQMILAPDNPSRWLLVQQGGVVLAFDADNPNANVSSVFLDISQRVAGTSRGLTGIAFHPDYPVDPRLFVTYTAPSNDPDLPLNNILSSFVSFDGGISLNADSEQIIMNNMTKGGLHPWGMPGFGTDGYLYVGTGQSSGDPQDPFDLEGKFLRIDIDQNYPYAIPPDNPFANGGGAPEVYALGLRNPFRWSVGPDGKIWAGDVSSKYWEEINAIEAGGNYGWPIIEGPFCREQPCNPDDFVAPVSMYDRTDLGPAAVLGGLVYRGQLFPELVGKYVYSDFVNGIIRVVTLGPDGDATTEQIAQLDGGNHLAEDKNGELYIVKKRSILRIVPEGSGLSEAFPQTVSALGCFDPADLHKPVEALIPYDINVPFWSDGVVKQRWLMVPDDSTVDIDENGDLQLPVGSMVFKNFRLSGQLIETRALVRHEDGNWAGYSYEWSDDESDAYLVERDGKNKTIGGQLYTYPGRQQCMQCHTVGAGHTLGLEVLQLNRSVTYPSSEIEANQLETYDHIGLLSQALPGPVANLPALPELADQTVDLADRVKAYFHSNCSQCHMPGESGDSDFDLRYHTDNNIVGRIPGAGDLGVEGALLVTPGEPEKSIIPLRIRAMNNDRMPPIGTNVLDTSSIAMVEQWISELGPGPDVSISNPNDGDLFTFGADIEIEASATDDGQITSVSIFAGEQLLSELTTKPYRFTWSGASTGMHKLTAVAYSDSGSSTVSSAVTIEVGPCDPSTGAVCPSNEPRLVLGELDSTRYGKWSGVASAVEYLDLYFTGTGVDHSLALTGFDIDSNTEVSVWLNGALIGNLSAGPDQAVNAGDVLLLPAALQVVGTNTLRFIPKKPLRLWGITDLLLSAGGVEPPSDNQSPLVSLVSPLAGSVYDFGAAIALEASASDGDGDVVRVEFFVNGSDFIGEATAAPYSVMWPEAPSGLHLLTAVVHDDDGASTTSTSVSVEVKPCDPSTGATCPTNQPRLVVSVLDSARYGKWGGTASSVEYQDLYFSGTGVDHNLSVTGFDIDSNTEVSVWLNGALIGHLSAGPDKAVNTGDVLLLPAALQVIGENKLRFIPKKPLRLWGITNLLLSAGGVEPPPDNQSPAVSLVSPLAGSVYDFGAAVALEASASDGDGEVVRVEFFVNGSDFIGEATAAPYSVMWTDAPPGPHVLTAVVYDDGGTSTTSASVSVEVKPCDPSTGTACPSNEPRLVLGVLDSTRYGKWSGTASSVEYQDLYFSGTGVDHSLGVTGFDIDSNTEVIVWLNGTLIGHLSAGPDKTVNTGDVLLLPAALQVIGENKLRFIPKKPLRLWGITDLLLL